MEIYKPKLPLTVANMYSVNMQNLQLPNLQSNWFSCKPLFLFTCLPPCRLLFSTPTCEQKPLCGICSNYLHGQVASGMYLEYFSYLFQCSLAAWDEHSQPGHFLAVQLQRLLWPSVWEQLTLMILGCTLSVLSPAVQMESAFLALLNQNPSFKGFWLCLVKPGISVSQADRTYNIIRKIIH